MNLTKASNELFKRSPDEVFPDLATLHEHCAQERRVSKDHWATPQSLRPMPGNDGFALKINGEAYKPNDWSFTQLCVLAGIAKDTINKLSPATAAMAFNETLPETTKPVQLFTSGNVVRSIHGHSYTRLWNADLVHMLREFATDFTPPPVSPINGATGIYCGEQDLFCFLIDPTGWCEIKGEAFCPGCYVWNSEVGRRSVGIQTFYLQQVCANHIIWNAKDVTTLTRKHTGKVGEALGDIRTIVEQLVEKRDAHRDGFVATIRKAMETSIGADQEEALKMLTKSGFTQQLAKRAVKDAFEGGKRFTIFTIVDALTRMAQEHKNAGDRSFADEKAGALLDLVTV